MALWGIIEAGTVPALTILNDFFVEKLWFEFSEAGEYG